MIEIIKKAIRAALIGNASLMTQLSNNVERVAYRHVYEDTALAYVIFSIVYGGDERTVASQIDVQIDVKAVATDGSTADTLADLIYAALHNKLIAMDAPWGCFDLRAIGIIDYEENTERTDFYHTGYTFRLRAHKV